MALLVTVVLGPEHLPRAHIIDFRRRKLGPKLIKDHISALGDHFVRKAAGLDFLEIHFLAPIFVFRRDDFQP